MKMTDQEVVDSVDGSQVQLNEKPRLCQENCVSFYNKLYKTSKHITAVPEFIRGRPFLADLFSGRCADAL